ncbi:hypothetical protein [Microvirga pudoricolor]|nr:hypothetical protein [Microvirga pudoricolor]
MQERRLIETHDGYHLEFTTELAGRLYGRFALIVGPLAAALYFL